MQVENYMVATSQIAQTTLRSVLGQHVLDELLSERDKINQILQSIIDEGVALGIKVSIVEVKDVEIRATCSARWRGRRKRSASGARRSSPPRASPGLPAAQGRRRGDVAGADHRAAPLPADAARDRRDEQLDGRLPDPDRVPRDARDPPSKES